MPPKRTISWLIEAALIWFNEAKGQLLQVGTCEARRGGGDILPSDALIAETLKSGEVVFVYLADDVAFMNLGR